MCVTDGETSPAGLTSTGIKEKSATADVNLVCVEGGSFVIDGLTSGTHALKLRMLTTNLPDDISHWVQF